MISDNILTMENQPIDPIDQNKEVKTARNSKHQPSQYFQIQYIEQEKREGLKVFRSMQLTNKLKNDLKANAYIQQKQTIFQQNYHNFKSKLKQQYFLSNQAKLERYHEDFLLPKLNNQASKELQTSRWDKEKIQNSINLSRLSQVSYRVYPTGQEKRDFSLKNRKHFYQLVGRDYDLNLRNLVKQVVRSI